MFEIFKYTLLFFHVFACVLLVLLVLMQRPRNEGLGAAFGGGVMDQFMGAQTSEFLIKGTVFLAAFFFIVTVTLASLETHKHTAVSEGERLRASLAHPTNVVSTNSAPVTAVTTTNALVSTNLPTSTNQPAVTASNAVPAVTNAPVSQTKPEEPSKKK